MEKSGLASSLPILESSQIDKFVSPPISPPSSSAQLTNRSKCQGRKHFVIAIIRFLRDELDHSECLPTQRMSLTCAIQSLEYAYKMENVHEDAATMGPTVDLWKVYMYPKIHQVEIMTVADEDSCQAKTFKEIGIDLMKNGKTCAAIDFFNRAVHLNPNYFKYYYLRGWCYHRIYRYESAMEDAQLSLLRHPEHSDSYCLLGSSYYQMRAFEKSIDCFIQAYRYDPETSFYKLMAYSVHDELVVYNKKRSSYRYTRTDAQFSKSIKEKDLSYIVNDDFPYISRGSTCNFEIVRRFGREIIREEWRSKKGKKPMKSLSAHVVTQPRVPASTGAVSRHYIPELPWTARYKTNTYAKGTKIDDFGSKPFSPIKAKVPGYRPDDRGPKPSTTRRSSRSGFRSGDRGPKPRTTGRSEGRDSRARNRGSKPLTTVKSEGHEARTRSRGSKLLTTIQPEGSGVRAGNRGPKPLTTGRSDSPGFWAVNRGPELPNAFWTTYWSEDPGLRTGNLGPKPHITIRSDSSGQLKKTAVNTKRILIESSDSDSSIETVVKNVV